MKTGSEKVKTDIKLSGNKLFKSHHIGTKLNLIFSIGLLVTIAAVVCFISVYNMNILEKDFANSCSYNMNAILDMEESAKADTAGIAESICGSSYISEAVTNSSSLVVANDIKNYITDDITQVAVFKVGGSKLFTSDSAIDEIANRSYISDALGGATESFVDVIGQNIYAVSIRPIKELSKTVGAVAVLRKLNSETALDSLKNCSGADYTIFMGDTRISTTVTKNGVRQVGTTMSADVAEVVIKNGQNYSGRAVVVDQDYIVNYTPVWDLNGNAVGALFTGKALAGIRSQNRSTTIAAIIIGILLFAVIDFVLIIFVKKRIVAPLKRIVTFSEEVARGNLGLSQALNDKYEYDANDEIGKAFGEELKTVYAIREYISEIDKVLDDLSSGNLCTPIVKEYNGDFISIRNSLTQVQNNLVSSMTEINRASSILTGSANEISAASQALAQGATEQAGAVEELNATIDEVYQNVKVTAENARDASKKTIDVGDFVKQGDQKVQEMMVSMNKISDASGEIEKIIKTIEDIAFQTNILALNAAVEAARAGVAGKGFAVVADEVRNLASKSAEAAKNTTVLIQESLRVVSEGSEKAGETAEVMNKVVESVESVVTTIAQISSGNEEQAVALGQIQSGMGQIAQVVHTTSASAEESAATAEELSAQARLLEELVGTFRLQ